MRNNHIILLLFSDLSRNSDHFFVKKRTKMEDYPFFFVIFAMSNDQHSTSVINMFN